MQLSSFTIKHQKQTNKYFIESNKSDKSNRIMTYVFDFFVNTAQQ